jgi:hypothetical protein
MASFVRLLVAVSMVGLMADVSAAAEKRQTHMKSAGSMSTQTSRTTGANAGANAVAGQRATVAMPLTAEECTGLGGKVTGSDYCNAQGQKACATVDKHGVIRVACIDEVSE